MSKHHHQNRTNQTNCEGASISIEDIQRRAYLIHEEKGGSELENWLEAEQVLKAEPQGA